MHAARQHLRNTTARDVTCRDREPERIKASRIVYLLTRQQQQQRADRGNSSLVCISSSSSIYSAILSRQIADTYHAMADHQKNTRFN